MVKDPPASRGMMSFKSWSGKTPHAIGQESLCVTTTDPRVLELSGYKRSHYSKKPRHCH